MAFFLNANLFTSASQNTEIIFLRVARPIVLRIRKCECAHSLAFRARNKARNTMRDFMPSDKHRVILA